MNPLLDLLADGDLAGLHFRTGGGTSRSVRAFISELTTMLNATAKKPLVITNDHEAVAIFRMFGRTDLHDERNLAVNLSGGQRFADISGYDAQLYVEVVHAGPHAITITLPADGTWAERRTPENTARSSLPVFDSDAISVGVLSLLDRWTQAGKLVGVAAPAQPTNSWVDPVYSGDISIANSPADLDPSDPRRRDSQWARTMRTLRRKVLGRDSGETIEGPAGRVSRQEFDAAYAAEAIEAGSTATADYLS